MSNGRLASSPSVDERESTYRRRLLDDVLDQVQPLLRAVSIHGPKSVGKTTSAGRWTPGRLVAASSSRAALRLAARSCTQALDGSTPCGCAHSVQREFPEQGYPVRKPETLRAWLRAYAAASSSTTTYTKILDAATASDSNKPAKETTISSRDALSSPYLLDPLPAWIPSRNHLDRLTQGPKHQLADPALAARLLDLDAAALLRAEQGTLQLVAGTILGALFEHLVNLSDGKILAIEVKLSDRAEDTDVKHLCWLAATIGDDLVDAMVVTTGEQAYRRRDGITVVPAALLGP